MLTDSAVFSRTFVSRIFLLSALFAFTSNAMAWSWNAAELLQTGTTSSSQKIVRDDAGNAKAFWVNSFGGSVMMVSNFSPTTGSWTSAGILGGQFVDGGAFDADMNGSGDYLVAYIRITDVLNGIGVLDVTGTVTATQVSANLDVVTNTIVKTAISDNGDAIVVWEQGSVLRYRLFRNGSWQAEGVLDTAASGALHKVDIAGGDLGNFTVVWIWDVDNQKLYGKRFVNGSWIGPETIGQPERAAPVKSPQVTMIGADKVLVVWEQPLASPGVNGIGARYFNGTIWEATQNIHFGPGNTLARWPHIASNDSGQAMASFGQVTGGVALKIYAAYFENGAWQATQEIGCPSAPSGQPLNVDIDKYGNAAVAYINQGTQLVHVAYQAGLGWLGCASAQGVGAEQNVASVSQNQGGLERRIAITPHHILGVLSKAGAPNFNIYGKTGVKDVYINNVDETTANSIVDLNMRLPINTVCGAAPPFFFTEMRFSNDNSNWSPWQATPQVSPFTQTVSGWDLTDAATGGNPSGGLKRVYIDYRNQNCSGVVTHDEIEYTPACVPSAEICDGIDNNCDGQIDEGLSTDADGDGYNTVGSCLAPANDCNDANAAINPGATEICDGLDNNCDLSIDEGLSTDADGDGFYASGSCLAPANDCNDANAAINPGATELCDGVDNNCANGVDESFNAGTSCFGGVGACEAFGMNVCTVNGLGTVCNAIPGTPSSETCDGIDNNCDGTVDEPFIDLGGSCTVGVGACLATGVTACAIDGSGTICSATAGTPTAEVCDGIDNNCDGIVDEGLSTDNDGDGHFIVGSCQVPADDCDDNNPAIWSCNTPVGPDPVQFDDPAGNATVTIEGITGGGDTTISSAACDTQAPVAGFVLASSPLCVSIISDAAFASAEVCIVYDPADLSTPLPIIQQCPIGFLDPSECTYDISTVTDVGGGLKEACVTVTNFSEFTVGAATDIDSDFIPDLFDNCPSDFNINQVDDDGDMVGNVCDNCTALSNADQRDTNGDGFGNVCDADLNNDGLITVTDFLLLRGVLNTADQDADLNGDGLVTVTDFLMLRGQLNQAPGPSGLVP